VPSVVPEDRELIANCRAGDIEAFSTIVSRYQDRVFNLAYRLLGNFEEARDVSQTAFIRAFESLGSFRGSSAFYTWLYRIVVNAALDARKARSRRIETGMEELDELAGDCPGNPAGTGSADDPVGSLIRAEEHERITRAIAALDDEHRTVVVLRDVQGLDYREIAQVTGLAKGTVKSRLHRARLLLRDQLKDLVS
jgi:RNA polymerase sigma-70 factor (ECF subfamily)